MWVDVSAWFTDQHSYTPTTTGVYVARWRRWLPMLPEAGDAMTDPTFTARTDLEAWAKDLASRANVAAMLALKGEPTEAMSIYASAIKQIKRVTIAHLHLED